MREIRPELPNAIISQCWIRSSSLRTYHKSKYLKVSPKIFPWRWPNPHCSPTILQNVLTPSPADANLSFYYLGKVIQNLTNTSLLDSYKGPNGGIKLGKKPEEITVIEIVEAIDGLKAFEKCFIGLSTCNTQSHCALHNDWKGIRNKIYEMLQNKNLAQLINS